MQRLVLPPATLPLLPLLPGPTAPTAPTAPSAPTPTTPTTAPTAPTADGKICVSLPSGRASDNCADVTVDEFLAALKNRKPTTVAAVEAMRKQTGRTFQDAGERREAWRRYLAWLDETNAPLHAEYLDAQGQGGWQPRVFWCFG